MNGTAKENGGRIPKKRDKPSRYGNEVGQIPAYATIEFMRVVPVIMSGPSDSPMDTWLELPDGSFTNYFLSGVTYFNILTNPTQPPPPVPTTSPVTTVTQETNLVTKTLTIRRTRKDGTFTETIDPIE